MRIESDSRNCGGCDFLEQARKGPFCDRQKKPVSDIKVCTTGPMYRHPDRGQDMSNLLGKVELTWRMQGERLADDK